VRPHGSVPTRAFEARKFGNNIEARSWQRLAQVLELFMNSVTYLTNEIGHGDDDVCRGNAE